MTSILTQTKYYVINNAIPGAGVVLGVIHADEYETACDKAEAMFPRHANGCGITVVEADD